MYRRNIQTPEDIDDFIETNVCFFEEHDDDIHPDSHLACSLFEEKLINRYKGTTF